MIPETSKRVDWPRLVKNALDKLNRRTLGLDSLSDYADDTAAAAGGVAVGGFYRTGSAIKVRVS